MRPRQVANAENRSNRHIQLRFFGSLLVPLVGTSLLEANAVAVPPTLDCVASSYCSDIEPLDEPTRAAMVGVVWRKGCPVGLEDLRRITFRHWSFDGVTATGQVVVNVEVAVGIEGVLKDLFDAKFPIASAKPIEAFGGDDDRSTTANNTSAFNCRAVTGGKGFSEHAWGRAIDINPMQNPYVRSNGTVLDPKAKPYLKRSALSESTGAITANGAVVKAFKRIGWTWGGNFNRVKDYQHFSATGP
jgi:D-alanyl-D-alanine carboxypeptidase